MHEGQIRGVLQHIQCKIPEILVSRHKIEMFIKRIGSFFSFNWSDCKAVIFSSGQI